MNRNGIPDGQEVSSSLDLDANGVKDVVQTDLKAVVMEGTTVKVGVSRAGCAAIKAIEAVESRNAWSRGRIRSRQARQHALRPDQLQADHVQAGRPGGGHALFLDPGTAGQPVVQVRLGFRKMV